MRKNPFKLDPLLPVARIARQSCLQALFMIEGVGSASRHEVLTEKMLHEHGISSSPASVFQLNSKQSTPSQACTMSSTAQFDSTALLHCLAPPSSSLYPRRS